MVSLCDSAASCLQLFPCFPLLQGITIAASFSLAIFHPPMALTIAIHRIIKLPLMLSFPDESHQLGIPLTSIDYFPNVSCHVDNTALSINLLPSFEPLSIASWHRSKELSWHQDLPPPLFLTLTLAEWQHEELPPQPRAPYRSLLLHTFHLFLAGCRLGGATRPHRGTKDDVRLSPPDRPQRVQHRRLRCARLPCVDPRLLHMEQRRLREC